MAPLKKRPADSMSTTVDGSPASTTPPQKKRRRTKRKKEEEPTDLHVTSGAVEQSSALLNLPGEVLEIIVKLLKFPELCRLTGTCKALRNFISPLQILNAIEDVAKAMETPTIKSLVLSGYLYTEAAKLLHSKACAACHQVRPHRYFVTPLYPASVKTSIKEFRKIYRQKKGRFTFAPYFSRDSNNIRPFKQRLSRLKLPPAGSESKLCVDCVAVHPALSDAQEYSRWGVGSDMVTTVICKSCDTIKKNKTEDREPSDEQLKAGLCNDCWAEDQGDWGRAEHSVDSRLEELRIEAAALEKYSQWMKRPKNQRWWEPKREFDLTLPIWKGRLSAEELAMKVKEVGDALVDLTDTD